MTKPLEGKTILVIEDEAIIALDLEEELLDAGASVIGPIPNLAQAKEAAAAHEMDAAVLDIMLGENEVYPAADILADRNIPFVFHSAHADPNQLKQNYPQSVLHPKPSSMKKIIGYLSEITSDQ